ncbi:MAG TPA: hypothetical protein VFN74_12125, partial [Chloroflexota bacterium]|nr:hypothetical protein [Chloroflexota bacterium]
MIDVTGALALSRTGFWLRLLARFLVVLWAAFGALLVWLGALEDLPSVIALALGAGALGVFAGAWRCERAVGAGLLVGGVALALAIAVPSVLTPLIGWGAMDRAWTALWVGLLTILPAAIAGELILEARRRADGVALAEWRSTEDRALLVLGSLLVLATAAVFLATAA